METCQINEKACQTDPQIRFNRHKFLKTLHLYLNAVSRYRLFLFNHYIQLNDSYYNMNLFNIRKEILSRFEWVIIELEQIIENLYINKLSVSDAQKSIDRPVVREVIQASLNVDRPVFDDGRQTLTDSDQLEIYKRELDETKEDLTVLNLFVHRSIYKINRLMDLPNSI